VHKIAEAVASDIYSSQFFICKHLSQLRNVSVIFAVNQHLGEQYARNYSGLFIQLPSVIFLTLWLINLFVAPNDTSSVLID